MTSGHHREPGSPHGLSEPHQWRLGPGVHRVARRRHPRADARRQPAAEPVREPNQNPRRRVRA